MSKLTESLFAALQQVLPQHTLSRIVGKLAESRQTWLKNTLIRAFIDVYNVDMTQAVRQRAEDFANFNDFFTRELKPDARPICSEPSALASPADGAVSELGDVELGSVMQAKGQYYSLMSLVGGDADICGRYLGGKFATIYLSPRDYHRVHMPCDGRLVSTTYVPGELFSVNQATANQVPGLFARNERLICEFESDQGPFVMILVGAMIVAGIETVWGGQVAPVTARLQHQNFTDQAPVMLKKGEEMGRFKLGSTVILLFPKDAAEWHESLANGTPTVMGGDIGRLL
ncbi:Phosphatidylserine decarboxylase proenzyme [BD1-7 clade bacterium]|uniref:Phosphatidylserine decarboxylase proenzyme n=1 Tax=BD1-7 clade bacterium TaxID=2029982 RepID=A0A5S9Q966_9GAMM|nr:Phosphatidylserine decarboxylase proenzyme [BD1-7 clade bacterium]